MSTKLTVAEKAAGSNPDKQCFGDLPARVQAIFRKAAAQDPSALQYRGDDGKWGRATNPTFSFNRMYRIHPNAETAAETERIALRANSDGDYKVTGYGEFGGKSLFAIAANEKCAGIVYSDRYGRETTQTSLNLAFGTPVAVIVKA